MTLPPPISKCYALFCISNTKTSTRLLQNMPFTIPLGWKMDCCTSNLSSLSDMRNTREGGLNYIQKMYPLFVLISGLLSC